MRITELFDNGQFVVTAEVGPPKGIHVDHLVEEAKTYLSNITAVFLCGTHGFLKVGNAASIAVFFRSIESSIPLTLRGILCSLSLNIGNHTIGCRLFVH